MTHTLDLIALARRTLERGEHELAAQMSVLALEGDEGPMLSDEIENENQNDADRDQLNDGSLLDALQDGTEGGDLGQIGGIGETPIAALELAHMAKQLRDEGFTAQACALNLVIESLTGSLL